MAGHGIHLNVNGASAMLFFDKGVVCVRLTSGEDDEFGVMLSGPMVEQHFTVAQLLDEIGVPLMQWPIKPPDETQAVKLLIRDKTGKHRADPSPASAEGRDDGA